MYMPGFRCQLRIDSVAAYSVADQAVADQTSRLCAMAAACLWQGAAGNEEGAGGVLPFAVTDGTACSGGMALSLMERFGTLHAVEVDDDRVADLRHNIQLLLDSQASTHACGGGGCRKLVSYHADYTALACQLEQDIVVLDPPWGGPMYTAAAGGGHPTLHTQNPKLIKTRP